MNPMNGIPHEDDASRDAAERSQADRSTVGGNTVEGGAGVTGGGNVHADFSTHNTHNTRSGLHHEYAVTRETLHDLIRTEAELEQARAELASRSAELKRAQTEISTLTQTCRQLVEREQGIVAELEMVRAQHSAFEYRLVNAARWVATLSQGPIRVAAALSPRTRSLSAVSALAGLLIGWVVWHGDAGPVSPAVVASTLRPAAITTTAPAAPKLVPVVMTCVEGEWYTRLASSTSPARIAARVRELQARAEELGRSDSGLRMSTGPNTCAGVRDSTYANRTYLYLKPTFSKSAAIEACSRWKYPVGNDCFPFAVQGSTTGSALATTES